jgi:hypothetical protein
MKNICYPTQGTCSKLINVSIDDDNKIHNVSFVLFLVIHANNIVNSFIEVLQRAYS